MLPFCGQTDMMFRASGGIPGMLGSYSGCPAEKGVAYCLLFPTESKWGNSRLLGYCLPSTCTLLEIARHVVEDPVLNKTFVYRDLMHVNDSNAAEVTDKLAKYITCSPRTAPYLEVEPKNIISWSIWGFISLLVLLATLYDYYWKITYRSIPSEVVMIGADGAVVRELRPPNVVVLESKNEKQKKKEHSPVNNDSADGMEGGTTVPSHLLSPEGGSEREEVSTSSKRTSHRGYFVRHKETSRTATTMLFGNDDDDAVRGGRKGLLPEFNTKALWSHRYLQKFLAEIPDVPNFRSFLNRTVLCLSLISSFHKWRYCPKSEVNLNVFNSWRVLAWMWILFFSSFWYSQQIPSMENVGSGQLNFLYAFLEKEAFAAFILGTFLVIAGFLSLHRLHTSEESLMSSPTERAKVARRTSCELFVESILGYVRYLIARFIRIIPISFIILILFPSAVSSTGRGPFWGLFSHAPMLHENCMKYWWTNLLLVNNILPLEENERCFPWSYYVALEFQLVALAPFIYFLGKHLHHRIFFSLLVCAMGISALLRYVELSSQGRVFVDAGTASHYSLSVGTVYQYPHLMFVPFCSGVMLYYLYRALRQREEMLRLFGSDLFSVMHSVRDRSATEDRVSYWLLNKLQKRYVRILIMWCSIAVTLSCILSAWFIHRNAKSDGEISVGVKVYESLILFPWCIALGFFALPVLLGYGGTLRRILTHHFWCGPSRLVLVAYLVTPVVIGFGNANSYEVMTMNFLSFIVQGFGYMAVTLFVSFVFHMLVERPCLHISSRGEY